MQYGDTIFMEIKEVDTHIKVLRAKLWHYAHFIKTIRGSGYMFEVKT